MKTGMDILRRAMNLLGYTNASGEIDAGLSAELYRRVLLLRIRNEPGKPCISFLQIQ